MPRPPSPLHQLVLCLTLLVAGGTFSSCSLQRPADWSAETHGEHPASYGVVFPEGRVLEMEIELSEENYTAMRSDLASILASGPGGGQMGARDGGMFLPPGGDGGMFLPPGGDGGRFLPPGGDGGMFLPPSGDGGMFLPPGGEGGVAPGGNNGAIDLLAREPMYVPVTVRFNGHAWTWVGMRFKGNSSLSQLGAQGARKMPFRLDFDQYEDAHPETTDQRFYGFKRMTFSANFGDDSQVREAFVNDAFARMGLAAARTTFVRITVRRGAAREYWGLYTMIEDPADVNLRRRVYGSTAGNLYKPDGTGANWTTFSRDGFEKKNNESAADWRDVEQAIAALHDTNRDRAAWRATFEARFDVNTFLRWLAANTVVDNWDAYGRLAHNYYLYGDPAHAGRLTWIPWDHNLSMNASFGGGGPGGASTTPAQVYLHTAVTAQWPLIRTLLDDGVYLSRYRAYLQEFLDGPFAEEAAVARLRALHALVAPHVVGARGEEAGSTTVSSAEAFNQSIDGASGLAAFVRARQTAARTALGSP